MRYPDTNTHTHNAGYSRAPNGTAEKEIENTIANGFNLDSYFGFIVSTVSVVRTAYGWRRTTRYGVLGAQSDQMHSILTERMERRETPHPKRIESLQRRTMQTVLIKYSAKHQ